MPEIPPLLKAVWRHLVVVLLGVHLIAITLQAFPSPGGGLRRSDWAQPTVRGEFEAWADRLRVFGVDMTVDELQDVVYAFAVSYADGHGSLIEPFKPYYRYCGTWQSWRMFVAPHRYPSRLQIRVREGRDWRVVYEARSPEATWRGHQLDHDRFRAALFRYGWGRKYPRTWRQFSDWIADRAAEDFPDARTVELRFASYKTLSPEQVRGGETPAITWKRRTARSLEARR